MPYSACPRKGRPQNRRPQTPLMTRLTETISSASNPLIKTLKSLERKKGRAETGLFLAEGARLIGQGLANGWQADSLMVAASMADRPHLAGLIRQAEASGARTVLAADKLMSEKEAAFTSDTMRQIEKQLLLNVIDSKWREHIVTLDHLRSAVNFRGLAQRDPLNEYKSEAFVLFEHMLGALREDVTRQLSRIRPLTPEEQAQMQQQMALQAAAANAQPPSFARSHAGLLEPTAGTLRSTT